MQLRTTHMFVIIVGGALLLGGGVYLLTRQASTSGARPGAGSATSFPATTSTPPAAIELPPLDAAKAEATRTAVADATVRSWIDSVVAFPTATDPCGEEAVPLLDTTLFERVAQLPDPVLAELFLDADASMGSMQAACATGDAARAGEERAAAVVTVGLIRQRLDSLP
jgi:hypothetical protein